MTMKAKPLRVAVISTGWISSLAIRAIVRRPHLELVGVWVHNAEKVGRDAGEIVGIGP
ncbi:MAG TPA: dihydrodipicolinate reductase, partial [Mycobacterium sp.]|nr:dihydrodipicolinate reductase [Mycobacterium sp.]